MRIGQGLGALGLATAHVLLSSFAYGAYCPSYTPEQTRASAKCAVDPVGGANPSPRVLGALFASVGHGDEISGAPSLGTLRVGCAKPRAPTREPATVPCHVLFAVAMQESGWRQFCVPTAPAGSVGAGERTLVSMDCGYGLTQVTSGMHVGDAPAFEPARVAADATYNAAVGAGILAGKWNAVRCVGDRDPALVEDWYAALWAYNGLSYANNPNNPNLTAGRGPYRPGNGGSYAYQERVLGWMEFPPASPPDGERWPPLAVAYPDRTAVGGDRAPVDLGEPSCGSPTSCVERRAVHRSPCAPRADGGVPPRDAPTDPEDEGSAPATGETTGGASPDGGAAVSAQGHDASACQCSATLGRRGGVARGGASILFALASLSGWFRRRSRRSARR